MSTPTQPMICPQTFYRVSIKGLVFNKDNQLLMTQDGTGAWTVPGGGMDHGENPVETLHREFDEELGLKLPEVDDRPLIVLSCLDLEFRKGPTPRLVVIYPVVANGEITHFADDAADARWVDLSEIESIEWSESIVDNDSNRNLLIQAISTAAKDATPSVVKFNT